MDTVEKIESVMADVQHQWTSFIDSRNKLVASLEQADCDEVEFRFGQLVTGVEHLIVVLRWFGKSKRVATPSLKTAIESFVQLLQYCVAGDQVWMQLSPLKFSQNKNVLRRLGQAVVRELKSSIPGYKDPSDWVARGAAEERSDTISARGQANAATESAALIADESDLNQLPSTEPKPAESPEQTVPASRTSIPGTAEPVTPPSEKAGVLDQKTRKRKESGKPGRPRTIDDAKFEKLVGYRNNYESAKGVSGFDFAAWLRHQQISKNQHDLNLNNTTTSKVNRRNSAD